MYVNVRDNIHKRNYMYRNIKKVKHLNLNCNFIIVLLNFAYINLKIKKKTMYKLLVKNPRTHE